MNGEQNLTDEPTAEEVKAASIPSMANIKLLQRQWIDFKAIGGLNTDDDGKVSKMTVQEFADRIGVRRETLWEWTNSIPDFWALVEKRRGEIFKGNRAANVANALYLQAVKGSFPHIKFYYETYKDWRPPAQKHEIEVSGAVDVMQLARKRQEAIEGETVGDSD